MRLRLRVRKVLFWGMLLLFCTLAGGLGFAYSYYTDSATLRTLIKAEVPRYLPGVQLDLGTVRVRPLIGEVKLSHVGVRQVIDGVNFTALQIPWLFVRVEVKELLKGHFEPREIILSRSTLRLCRRKDGTWNLQGLLASPWPAPPVKETPPIVIQNGTILLADASSAPGGPDTSVAVLRDASIKIESAGGRSLKFEGWAKGDVFDHLGLKGTIDLDTGRVTLSGDVARLVPSDKLFKCLPPEVGAAAGTAGLSAGEFELNLNQVVYDPAAETKVHCDVSGRLRGGVWSCLKLPFPINDVTGKFSLRDRLLTIKEASGSNGSTSVHVQGSVLVGESAEPPLDLHVDINELELDDRLRKKLPPQFAEAWDQFEPRGRVNLAIDVSRSAAGRPPVFQTSAECLDVGMKYRFFKYPLDHIRGHVDWVGKTVSLNLGTDVGGKPLHAKGTIENPGPGAVVKLDFQGTALPIDKTLLDAIPPDIKKVIDTFQPSGSVRGQAHFERRPPLGPGDDPKGRITIDAGLDLNERCAIRWVNLPYPVENLTGHLELHPDRWTFKDMRGGNGQAVVTADGEVRKVGVDAAGKDQLKVELNLQAEHLPFDQELQQSLPQAWQKTWPVLNPIGSSDIDAHIRVEPGKPEVYHIEIVPNLATSVRLKFERMRRSATDPGGVVKIQMEDVTGRFVFDNGQVNMHDVEFKFRESPVKFAAGTVRVWDDGSFQLAVKDLWVREFRFDAGLREKMPPLMAQFARRLDDGGTFNFSGDLMLNWSGRNNDSVRCLWDHVCVVLCNNKVEAGLPLEHIQGTLHDVKGASNGDTLEVHGVLDLGSVYLLGQQVTRVEAPFHVRNGLASLEKIKGELLGGEIGGNVQISLAATPQYSASLALRDANLESYARTLPGRQSFRGMVSANVEFKGFGSELRTLEGQGEAHMTQGNLGELPGYLKVMKALTLSPVTKSAFDSADVYFKIQNGESFLDPIRFTGDAFSLLGRGTLDVQGALDLRLRVLFARDSLHLRLFSDALREASGQFLVIRVLGTPSNPNVKPEVLPAAKAIAERRAARLDAGGPPGERRLFSAPVRP